MLRRRRVDEETAGLLEGIEARVSAKLAAFQLNDVVDEVEKLAAKIGDENLPERVAAARDAARLAAAGIEVLVAAINSSPGRSVEVREAGRQPRWMDIKAADRKIIVFASRGGENVTRTWDKVAPETLYQAVLAYGGKMRAPAECAALLAVRGSAEGAKRIIADEVSAETALVQRFISMAGERDGSEKRYVFASLNDLAHWQVSRGDWRLGRGVIEQRSGEEAAMSLRGTLKAAPRMLRVSAAIVLDRGAGFAALKLEAPEGVKAVLHLDDDGARFEIHSAGGVKIFRIEDGVEQGMPADVSITVERGKINAACAGRDFPETEVFGAEALSYILSIESMGRTFSVREVSVTVR
ncbi:MAG TPA: hypothetical protein ENN09_00565 [Planctomycetes bacterium]|nr:hypothetical protein [Planctomycetota bacterium]